jgi:hypothetical protein
MLRVGGFALGVLLVLASSVMWADDLADENRFLCSPVQATVCFDDGECEIDLPWNLNIPEFIEVDLDARRHSTTAASGENRMTPIENVSRRDGLIVLQGFEMGRAFSWVISEETGQVTAAIASEGRAVSVFGSCTPIASAGEPGRK